MEHWFAMMVVVMTAAKIISLHRLMKEMVQNEIMRLIDADEFSRIFDDSAIGEVCDEHAELETAGVNNV